MTIDLAAEYTAARARANALVADLGPEQLATPVLACPAWTVGEVVAHLAGAARDIVDGNMEGAPGDKWTSAHVTARRDLSIGEILAEWNDTSATLEARMAETPERFTFMIADVASHEQDMRSALGAPVDRPSQAIAWMVNQFAAGLGRRLDEANLPGLRLESPEGAWDAGSAAPGATVKAPSSFDLLRGMTGRRSVDQLSAWWSGGPVEPYLGVFSVFEIRPTPLDE